MISNRQKLVLIAIIEEYVKTGEPVGSRTLSKRPELQFSSATLRNDMADLEDLGYLEKTHISSGRVPSEKGYRLYVETILKEKALEEDNSFPMIDEIFAKYENSKEQAISESMALVSDITNYASIVLGNSAQNSRIRKLEFISLQGQYAIILMITDQGHVESKRIIVPDGISVKEIEKVVEILDEIFHNHFVSEIPNLVNTEYLTDEIRDFIRYHESLVGVFINAFSQMAKDKYLVTGQANILAQPEFQDIEKVKDLFQAIERRDILKVIEADNDGITIKIGQENEVRAMQDCTIITVPYEANDGSKGSLSILGPTRMEYEKVIPLLEYIAKNVKKII